MGHKKHSKHHHPDQKAKSKTSLGAVWQSVGPVIKLLAFGMVAGIAYLILNQEDQPESGHEMESKETSHTDLPEQNEALNEVIKEYGHETPELNTEYQSETNSF